MEHDKREEDEEIEGYEDAQTIAEHLGVSRSTIYDWVREGYIPHYRISPNRILFKISEIEEWIEGNHNEGRKERRLQVNVG